MINIGKYILILFLFICEVFSENSQIYEYVKREHSLTKPYQGTGMTIPFWDFFGSTMITTGFIRLTPDIQSRRGAIFNKIPLRYRNWDVQIHFKIYGHGKELYGDGIAFWYIKDPSKPGNIFGNSDYFTGLGVFFDTYANQNGQHNHGHPYISAMINNGSLHYDHDRDGTHTELAGCEAKFRGVDHDTIVSIRYNDDVITVSTDIEGQGSFTECFSVKEVVLPTGYFIGVSAATGDLSDNHDVISIRTYELETTNEKSQEDRSKMAPSASFFAPPRDHVEDAVPVMSNFKFFFLIVCAIIGVVLLIAVGMIVFQKQQETS